MSLKEKLLQLLGAKPKLEITFKQAARRFNVNTGAVGSAARQLPRKYRNRIRAEAK